MRRRSLLLAFALASCASPDPSLFTLAPIRGTPRRGAPALVELRRPGIAGYLDRSEITRSNTPYQIKLATGERWGEPFGDMVGRVLAEDLNSRLTGTSVFTAAGAISVDSGAKVEIDIQRFDADAAGQITLIAQVAVTKTSRRGAPLTRSIRLIQTPTGTSTAAYVAAMSQALADASEQIATLLRR